MYFIARTRVLVLFVGGFEHYMVVGLVHEQGEWLAVCRALNFWITSLQFQSWHGPWRPLGSTLLFSRWYRKLKVLAWATELYPRACSFSVQKSYYCISLCWCCENQFLSRAWATPWMPFNKLQAFMGHWFLYIIEFTGLFPKQLNPHSRAKDLWFLCYLVFCGFFKIY